VWDRHVVLVSVVGRGRARRWQRLSRQRWAWRRSPGWPGWCAGSGDDYAVCQQLADAARMAGIDGLLTPSAGLTGDHTLAVLARQGPWALAPPAMPGWWATRALGCARRAAAPGGGAVVQGGPDHRRSPSSWLKCSGSRTAATSGVSPGTPSATDTRNRWR